MNTNNLDQDNGLLAQKQPFQETTEVEVTKMATRSEKAKYRYSDFYCFMSLTDFTAYVSRDDNEGEVGFAISRSSEPAA